MELYPTEYQSAWPSRPEVEAAVIAMAEAAVDARGAIFTKREVVDFILDLTGYTSDKPLHETRLLEPSMGQGDFLIPAIERLIKAYRREVGNSGDIIMELGDCIEAVELHRSSYDVTRIRVMSVLQAEGLTLRQSRALCKRWLRQGDFLLLPFEQKFTHIIGNPPYVRQELIPDVLVAEYRRRFSTIYDRADIYIPFIERSLSLLAPNGHLGFICPDRWLKNRYGGPLRQYVAKDFRFKHFIDMVNTDAFLSDVIAYPAIVVISRQKPGPTRIASRPEIEAKELHKLAQSMVKMKLDKNGLVTEIAHVARSAEPWMLESTDQLNLMRRIEGEFPTLEEAGCKVGIGVATGADQVFIGLIDQLDIEPDRKLPLVMTRDILDGVVKWRGFCVINPFGPDGKLVSLHDYPKLATYLKKHGAKIKARHVSKKNPQNWYRTIDRIYPELAYVPKLLIPDIKGEAHIVYEPGKLYPHHNLYFVTSTEWSLRALQAVLLSNVTRTFMRLYSTKMHGGCLRFQAQYLRRLRLPHWRDVPAALRAKLIMAGESRNVRACDAATAILYKLTPIERQNIKASPGVADAA